jgi:hypothetical protein
MEISLKYGEIKGIYMNWWNKSKRKWFVKLMNAIGKVLPNPS